MRFLWWWLTRPKPPEPPPSPEPEPPPSSELLLEINRARISYGLNPLEEDDCLSEQAQAHSARMKATGSLSHNGFNARLRACGKGAGSENVAAGYRNARECVNGWLNSPGHRRNLLGNWTLCGVGISTDGIRLSSRVSRAANATSS